MPDYSTVFRRFLRAVARLNVPLQGFAMFPNSPNLPGFSPSRRRFVRNLATSGAALCAASCGLSFDAAAFARSLKADAARKPIDVDSSRDPGVSDA